jgi:hypothetical protein
MFETTNQIMKDHIKSIQTLRTELTATLKPGASEKKSGGRLSEGHV